MTDQELQQLRREKWRLNGEGLQTFEQAAEFIESVGFCVMYPLKPMPLVPTFIGAYVGSDEGLPNWQHAFSDPRAQEATQMMVRLLRQRVAYEANLFGLENNFLVAASAFPYFYAVVGDRNPRQVSKPGFSSGYSPLARDAFEGIRREGVISKQKLAHVIGGSVSASALDHALGELWSKLRITRVDYDPKVGASWDALYRWSPDAVREGINLSVGEALSALVSKYLECVVAAEPNEVQEFLGKLVPRSKVKEVLNALLAARELSFVRVGSRSLVQITSPREEPVVPRERRRRGLSEAHD